MKIELVSFDEATGECQLDVDEEGRQYLLTLGFNAMLRRGLESLLEAEEDESS